MHLLGVRPIWDHNNVVEDVELVPSSELGRPRVDVVIQAASLFRDTFPDRMKLLDKAVRLAAACIAFEPAATLRAGPLKRSSAETRSWQVARPPKQGILTACD